MVPPSFAFAGPAGMVILPRSRAGVFPTVSERRGGDLFYLLPGACPPGGRRAPLEASTRVFFFEREGDVSTRSPV